MGNISKAFSLIIIAVAVSLTLLVIPSFAQTLPSSIPTPSIPEFSFKYVNASYNVPSTSSIDPYTGQTITNPSYHVDNVTLVMVIQNQPLVYQYKGFFYNVQIKGHYAANWTQLYLNEDLPQPNANSTQTIVTLGYLTESGLFFNSKTITVPNGGQIDLQVEAMIGQTYKVGQPLGGWAFQGETSGWSNTQTLTVSDGSSPTNSGTSSSSSPNSTVTPQQSNTQTDILFGLSWEQVTIILLAVAVIVLTFAIVLSRRRSKATSNAI